MAEMGTAAKLIEVATAEIGTVEGPKDNETKYGKFTKADFQPWCGSFVNWCGNEAGVKIPNTVYTPGKWYNFPIQKTFGKKNDDRIFRVEGFKDGKIKILQKPNRNNFHDVDSLSVDVDNFYNFLYHPELF